MAIDKEELRIGNLVYSPIHAKIGKLLAIEMGGRPIIDIGNDTPFTTSFSGTDCLRPIPLSSDILLACGFTNIRDVHWCIPSSDAANSFEVCLWSDHVSYTKNNHHHVEIKSLHQLMNLYFSLTNQELIYNPH
jgi:hypothetical protein